MNEINGKKSYLIIFLTQLLITLVLSTAFYFTIENKDIALSVFLGGLVYCGPSLFANFFMERASNKSAQQIVAKAYLGTLYKTIITICLFVYVYQHAHIDIAYFVVGYLVSYLVQYAMSYVLHYRN